MGEKSTISALVIAALLAVAPGCAATGDGFDAWSDTGTDVVPDADAVHDSPWDSPADTVADGMDTVDVDTPWDVGPDAVDPPVDTSDVTGDDPGPDTPLSDCEASGGTCVAVGMCTDCPPSHEPSWGERGCGTGHWCCVPASTIDTPCHSAGGYCIPATGSARCAPGYGLVSLACGSIAEGCCARIDACP